MMKVMVCCLLESLLDVEGWVHEKLLLNSATSVSIQHTVEMLSTLSNYHLLPKALFFKAFRFLTMDFCWHGGKGR